MAFKLGRSNKFRWGLNIDDIWTYAGLAVPKSMVIPYLFSIKVPGGRFSLPQQQEGKIERSPKSSSPTTEITGARNPRRSAQALASFLKGNAVDFVRCWFQWNFFEQAMLRTLPRSYSLQAPPLKYLFPLDEFVSRMTEAGIGIIGAIGSGYHRFLPLGVQIDSLDEYVKKLTLSSTKIVRHYKDKVKFWQIENEPNWWKAHYVGQWRKGIIWLHSRNQEPILKALYGVVRSECPDGTVVINLEADEKHTDWRRYAKYCDVIGLDFYPNYSHSAPSDAQLLGKTAQVVKKETGLPTFVIETGYPTGPRIFGYSEEKQVRYIHSACEQAFSCDAIRGLGWFRLSDSYWKSFPPQENYFGLLTKEGKPKPGWKEYASQIRS